MIDEQQIAAAFRSQRLDNIATELEACAARIARDEARLTHVQHGSYDWHSLGRSVAEMRDRIAELKELRAQL